MNNKLLYWNFQGASSEDLLDCLFDLVKYHKPSISILAETKISSIGAYPILRRTYYNTLAVSEAWGFAGGLWVFWNTSQLDIKVICINSQMMILTIIKKGCVDWVLTPIYASPKLALRNALCKCRAAIGKEIHEPWLVFGGHWSTFGAEGQVRGQNCELADIPTARGHVGGRQIDGVSPRGIFVKCFDYD